MPRKEPQSPRRQGPPLQFRPGRDLERLVNSFAAEHSIPANEACKCLIALAVTTMDGRYYELIHQLAEAMGGPNAFARACVHVQTMLRGVEMAQGGPLLREPERSLVIVHIVRNFLADVGRELQTEGLWFVDPETTEPQPDQFPTLEQTQRVGQRITR